MIEGGRIGEFPAGFTVYSEADVEGLAVILADLRADKLVRTAPGRVEIVDPVRLSRELWSRGQKNGGPEGPPDVTRQRRLPA